VLDRLSGRGRQRHTCASHCRLSEERCGVRLQVWLQKQAVAVCRFRCCGGVCLMAAAAPSCVVPASRCCYTAVSVLSTDVNVEISAGRPCDMTQPSKHCRWCLQLPYSRYLRVVLASTAWALADVLGVRTVGCQHLQQAAAVTWSWHLMAADLHSGET
jgi:hypothetical protein